MATMFVINGGGTKTHEDALALGVGRFLREHPSLSVVDIDATATPQYGPKGQLQGWGVHVRAHEDG